MRDGIGLGVGLWALGATVKGITAFWEPLPLWQVAITAVTGAFLYGAAGYLAGD